jgi:hypothetical protein
MKPVLSFFEIINNTVRVCVFLTMETVSYNGNKKGTLFFKKTSHGQG